MRCGCEPESLVTISCNSILAADVHSASLECRRQSPGTLVRSRTYRRVPIEDLIVQIQKLIEPLRFFIALQCLDVITTLVFLSKGIEEGNPLVRLSIMLFQAPWLGVAAAKVTATCIGHYCHRTGRTGLLRKANAGYSLVVGWNLIAIAAATLAK